MYESDEDIVIFHSTSFFAAGLQLGKEVMGASGPKLVDFKRELLENVKFSSKIEQLRKEVHDFSSQFSLPGLKEY